jgi:nitrogen regulatory protein P-II 1
MACQKLLMLYNH